MVLLIPSDWHRNFFRTRPHPESEFLAKNDARAVEREKSGALRHGYRRNVARPEIDVTNKQT